MKKSVLIFILLLTVFSIGYTQTYKYNIISKGRKAGVLTATKVKGGNASGQEKTADAPTQALSSDQEIIQVRSEFDVHLFIEVHASYKMDCKYDKGELVEYSVETFKDGNLHSSSKGTKEGGMYRFVEDGDQSEQKGDIRYSGAMLYFKEPKGISTVFSEIHAKDKPVEKIGEGHYKLIDPSTGHSNQYFYRNGVLIKALIDHSLFSFSLVLE